MDANSARTTHRKTGLPTWFFYRREGVFPYTPGAALRGLLKRDQSSRPPSGVPRATLCIGQMTAADGLLS
ncbi:hypothetical protein TNCV_1089581 [Trichonephila clavipes]|uniref:Uncharacterized protein n=1 Tax=Trichonephila clavipes TaxID=2585209 RepID=A0A8X6VFY9_TRICX|nr:hypothetical protein TNCV_1089581 [Trichonephila clavipes]